MATNFQPAFPVGEINSCDGNPGMSIREYFAAAAMQGVLANSSLDVSRTDFTKAAVKFADALIAELAKEQP